MDQYSEIELGSGKYPFNPQANFFDIQKKQKKNNVSRYQLPKTVIAQVKSKGWHYLCGPSHVYDSSYPDSLIGKVSKEEFADFINQVNSQIDKYWPCEFTFILAYTCSLFTLCLSLKLPESCMDEVQKFLGYVLERWNETWNIRGVYVEYKRWLCSKDHLQYGENQTQDEIVEADSEEEKDNEIIKISAPQ